MSSTGWSYCLTERARDSLSCRSQYEKLVTMSSARVSLSRNLEESFLAAIRVELQFYSTFMVQISLSDPPRACSDASVQAGPQSGDACVGGKKGQTKRRSFVRILTNAASRDVPSSTSLSLAPHSLQPQ